MTIRCHALILLYMPKIKAVLINANYTKFKNERRILAVCDVHCIVHVQYVCPCIVQCVCDQTGTKP